MENMSISDFVKIAIPVIGFIVWLVRLEAKSKSNSNAVIEIKDREDEIFTRLRKNENLTGKLEVTLESLVKSVDKISDKIDEMIKRMPK